MIEPSGREHSSVVFMGRRSFRMEIATLPGTNELAIPKGASDIATERIFGPDRAPAFQASLPPLPAIRSASTVSRPMLVGLCLTTFAFGILLTWTFNRSRAIQEARLPAPQSTERTPELSPAPSPSSALLVEPIVVAAAPAVLDPPPSRRVILKPARDSRVRTVRAIQTKRPIAAVEAEQPETAPVDPPPAKKWVDPFAE